MSRPPPDPAEPRVTLAQVARAAGVSEITASRALRDAANVAPRTLEQVRAAARALDYVPNRMAGALAGGASRQVAVVLPSLSNSVFADVLRGLETRLDHAGHHPILGVSNYDPEQEERLIRDLLSWRPAGIVIAPAASTEGTRRMLAQSGLPVVEIMDIDPPPIDTAVGLSQRAAGRAMAAHLTGRGYRRFAYLGHDIAADPRALARLEGLRAGLADVRARFEEVLTLPGPSSVPLGREGLAALLARRAPGGLAVCFSNDDMAVGAMFHCMAAGLAVPGDVALAGFNGLAIGQALPQPLTSIASMRDRIGAVAADTLLARLRGEEPARSIDVGFALIPGATA
ncbi:LacI family DNA-binding transcriptional regulator [Rhodobaculum claviforme]|uniref:LacI family transcriptional regulator n=1 Tax=Rhodobaculum claviforme TaxID=1549854 RepID=A0A934TJL8_9RHOB|nr:LacI family DNA-binding transcriptional regulator [Rhodobaculum claviforme]MBK5927365.1 LacI family transcriptional regulator [Rhodobaculum claviforme]